jgi:hypothetical protein
MRSVHAAALSVAALLLATVASAQGLGDAAAREKEKRKAQAAKPAKVYTEDNIGRSMAPVSSAPDLPLVAPDPSAPAQPTDGQAASGGAAAGQAGAGQPAAAPTDAEKAAEEARAKAEADWRKRLETARKEESVYREVIDKLQLELNDTSGGFYNPGRASKIAFQEENKQRLAEVQGRITALEDEGRRAGYR